MATQPHNFTSPYYLIHSTAENWKNCPEIAGAYVQTAPAGVKATAKTMFNGIEIDEKTPPAVRIILVDSRYSSQAGKQRLILEYGDTTTGRAWEDPRDADRNAGYIGRSTGSHKIPLLIRNRRSMGGEAILTGNIVRIRTARGKRVLYQHPNFHYKTPATDEQPV